MSFTKNGEVIRAEITIIKEKVNDEYYLYSTYIAVQFNLPNKEKPIKMALADFHEKYGMQVMEYQKQLKIEELEAENQQLKNEFSKLKNKLKEKLEKLSLEIEKMDKEVKYFGATEKSST